MSAPVEEFGPYLVYEQIGIGGMASVHRAETRGIEGFRRPIALKRMLPAVATNADLVQAFAREARLASHLRHENVAQTYDLGKVGDTLFIAMELVPGRDLREILKQCVRVGGPMPLPMALNILNQICDALDYAHDLCDESGTPLGIIHRDVSPSNIIVSDSGVTKLIDFGIAKASAVGMQTMSGTIKGKFGYMAPEYIEGKIDARADLFALGIVAYELLTNKPLFTGKDDMDTLMRVKKLPIAPPSSQNPTVPAEIDAIVMTALERDPNRRWQRASALRMAMTAESKRLGLVAMNSQVVSWIDWAFQRRREPSEPSISIQIGTQATMEAQLARTRVLGPTHSAHDTSQPNVVAREDLEATTIRPSRPLPPELLEPRPEPRPTPMPPPLAYVPSPSAVKTLPMPLMPMAPMTRPPPAQEPEDIRVTGSAIIDEQPVEPPVRRISNFWIAVFIVIAAVAAGVVVYFAWPYFR